MSSLNSFHNHAHSHSKKATKRLKTESKLPATVLCGFLGSGKTTLLNNILNNRQGYKVAVIVNDMSEISIDASEVKNGQAVFKRTEEKLVELSNGCICCTLRTDLVKEVSKLAKKNKFDYLLIESTGMAEPLPIAQAFSFEDGHGKTLYEIAKIDTMVTVVDAFNFYNQISSIEKINEVKIENKTSDSLEEIPIAQLFIDQIEFANVIIINKVDLVSKEQISSIEELIKKLNPTAEIIHSEYSKIPLNKVLMTNKFDFEEAQRSSKWLDELAKQHTPETEEYGFSSFLFKSRKPFNPQKLYDLMQDPNIFKKVVRAKGYIWIATNMFMCAFLNIVGEIKTLEPHTIWWASIKKSKWGNNKKEINLVKDSVKNIWDKRYGDRRNEMVFIGKDMNKEELLKTLNSCLLTDEEFEKGDEEWNKIFTDPFTEWQKAVKTHPMRKNFKEIEDGWEEVDSDEESGTDEDEGDSENSNQEKEEKSINEEKCNLENEEDKN